MNEVDSALSDVQLFRQAVYGLALDCNGRRLATASGDGRVCVWDLASGQVVRTFHAGATAMATAFSPDGRRLAATGAGPLQVWDLASGKEILSLKAHGQSPGGVCFSHDGKRLAAAGGTDNSVTVWDLDTGLELLTLRGPTDSVRDVAFDRDDRRLACGAWDGTVHIWDTAPPPGSTR